MLYSSDSPFPMAISKESACGPVDIVSFKLWNGLSLNSSFAELRLEAKDRESSKSFGMESVGFMDLLPFGSIESKSCALYVI